MKSVFILFIIAMLNSCQHQSAEQSNPIPVVSVEVPAFSADSAYLYIERQVTYGPRVPNTLAHRNCAAYLVHQLELHGAVVTEQHFQARAFDGTILNAVNIIGSYIPDAPKRILLFAHWDTRPWSDHDPDPANYNVPVTGANDGASGVGVLLEIARQLARQTPSVGVDIIFFDAEDYGAPEGYRGNEQHSWALGSQYWGRNPHIKGYKAAYGILLDMVGATGATFYKEQISTYYAPDIVQKVWNTARHLGFQHFFIDKPGGSITDDHLYVNRLAGIPSINIIHYDPNSQNGFFEHWHTVNDTMENIDRETLHAVGTTLMHIIYNER
jgi:Zn-dependent M28 family amino/carboxypeptidase